VLLDRGTPDSTLKIRTRIREQPAAAMFTTPRVDVESARVTAEQGPRATEVPRPPSIHGFTRSAVLNLKFKWETSRDPECRSTTSRWLGLVDTRSETRKSSPIQNATSIGVIHHRRLRSAHQREHKHFVPLPIMSDCKSFKSV
jgi:hypothetical protein